MTDMTAAEWKFALVRGKRLFLFSQKQAGTAGTTHRL